MPPRPWATWTSFCPTSPASTYAATAVAIALGASLARTRRLAAARASSVTSTAVDLRSASPGAVDLTWSPDADDYLVGVPN